MCKQSPAQSCTIGLHLLQPSTYKPAKVMSPVMQADLRAGRTTSDDEKLRVLASSILSAAARGASSYVKIHQLQQVCCQA